MPIFPRRVADINKVTFTGSFRSQNGGVVGEIIWMDFLGVSIVWPGKGRGACGRPVAQCHDARAGLPKSANPVLYVMHIHIWGLPVAQCHDARAGLPKSANPVLYVMHIHVMLLFFLLPFLVRS